MSGCSLESRPSMHARHHLGIDVLTAARQRIAQALAELFADRDFSEAWEADWDEASQ